MTGFIGFILVGLALTIGKAIAGFLWLLLILAVVGIFSLLGRIFGGR